MGLLKRLFQPVQSITPDEAGEFMQQHREGTYTLLDVRQPGEYEQAHLPGAVLIPLPGLDSALSQLDPDKPTIVYCAIGGRSRIAAGMLTGRGFGEVYNLKGGIKAWKGLTVSGPRDLELNFITGDETPAEIIAIAHEMEEGQKRFYMTALERTSDPDVRKVLNHLATIEEKHKMMLLDEYSRLHPHHRGPLRMNPELIPKIMEGGLAFDDFMKSNQTFLNSVSGLLNLAMMLEAQSLDLYLRFADTCRNKETKRLLLNIASEEKTHLEKLGELFDAALSADTN